MMFRQFFKDFIDLIFPRCCAGCNSLLIGSEEIICTSCRITLPRVGLEGLHRQVLENKFINEPAIVFTHAFLIFTKKGKVQRLLHALKYRGNQQVGLLLGEMFGQEMRESGRLPAADLIVSVPLHAKKKKLRGYNQSDLLAEGFSKATGIPWSAELLYRKKFTQTQTGKNRIERRENVSGVFGLKQPVNARKIIIIDDVLTTGATLEACVQPFKGSGCGEFVILTIAVAEH